MLIGALLLLSWLVLMIRYPLRALPVSLGALLGLGLVALWVIWEEQREARLLSQLELRLVYAPDACPAARPLQITLHNRSSKPLSSLRWNVTARTPGTGLNLVTSNFDTPQYSGSKDLQPGEQWQACMRLPPLRSGYRVSALEFHAERLQGHFAD